MSSSFAPGRLQLTAHVDDDGTADLFAIATSSGFAGQGSAWFNISEIRDFATRIAMYPLQDTVEIAGGFFSDSRPGELVQTHLSICVYLLDGRGQLGVRVTLTDPHHADAIHSVALEFRTIYNRLERFSRDLLNLVDGRATEAVLEEELL
ncbi:hypothetical protein [Rhodopirellula sp. MGV]|uniref:hypothetical protein n=1 Tax=Rhodopirellula sp. MGV TaxID=2023130 RepID=UPI000B96676B|nr:hypothetical protein [Rhodopirellula sp. MGV]OYP34313.1 hypothetical protein CGZ80_14710 [Rhodopirellula sp. MGV]PNY36074.1 hypothetical protein C2E31_14855 [Rhodopirellula baltica]